MRLTLSLFMLAAIPSACSLGGASSGEPASSSTSSAEALTEHESFHTVAEYDPARDASADLQATIAHATRSNKRILLEIGGKW